VVVESTREETRLQPHHRDQWTHHRGLLPVTCFRCPQVNAFKQETPSRMHLVVGVLFGYGVRQEN